MTTTDLTVATVPASEAEVSWKLAQRIAKTEFVPQSFRNRPDAVLAAILTGREIGIGPMQSLQSINVIQGKPTLAPELMRALVFRAGHRIDVIEHSETACKMHGVRADSGAEASVTWTMDDAQRAKLAGKGAWLTYPRAMLLARATSELCRLLFPDVIAGCSYTAEEIGGEVEIGAEPPDVAAPPSPVETFAHLAPTTEELGPQGEVLTAGTEDLIEDAEVVADPATGEVYPEYVPQRGTKPAGEKQIRYASNLIEERGMPDDWHWWPLPDNITSLDCSWLIDQCKLLPEPTNERRSTMRTDEGEYPEDSF